MQTQPTMSTNLSVRRTRPAKPIRQQAVELSKITNSETAIEFLDLFVREARKEIRKREKLTMKGKFHKTDCDSVSFINDNFSLTIDFKGGLTL